MSEFRLPFFFSIFLLNGGLIPVSISCLVALNMIVWYLMLELFWHCSFYFFILFSIYLFLTNWKCEYLSIAWQLHGAIIFTLDIYCTINGGYLWYYMYVKKHIVWNNISPVFVQTNPTSSGTNVYYCLKHNTLLEYPF